MTIEEARARIEAAADEVDPKEHTTYYVNFSSISSIDFSEPVERRHFITFAVKSRSPRATIQALCTAGVRYVLAQRYVKDEGAIPGKRTTTLHWRRPPELHQEEKEWVASMRLLVTGPGKTREPG